MSDLKVTIVIPTMQKREDILENLVKTLNNDDSVGEIIVIDNSVKGIKFNYDKLRVITPETNIFVNPAWNLGVKEAKYDIVGLLNDDIIIADNFCSSLINVLPDNVGIIGYTKNSINTVEQGEQKPQKTDIKLEKTDFIDFGFGICMFFKKDNYPAIPEDLKIMYGDCWIFDEYKKQGFTNYVILGQKIFHLGSLTSSSKVLQPIIKKDKKAYIKHTIKWHQRIFSIKEYSDCVKVRLFGMNFKIKDKH